MEVSMKLTNEEIREIFYDGWCAGTGRNRTAMAADSATRGGIFWSRLDEKLVT
jgi:hypothetical protein